ncbi:MAG: zinc-binding dehydrogenase [Lentisphaerae bacterium GWF2_45_14]|nr:MAG: zinc-binding dehydrogenase [Lentisphaerae bacterium GWF2_45_14]
MVKNDFSQSRAVVIERPRDVKFRKIKLTDLRPESYVAQTTISAISSGTDMKTWKGEQHPEQCWYPLVPGYENVGKIVHVGEEAGQNLKLGDRVMINECRRFGDVCAAWGGNSEFVIKDSVTAPSPFDYMVKIPDNVSDKDAVLAYLPCVALKGIRRMNFRKGETVVVTGAGMIGISAMQILKIMHPDLSVICVEQNAFRREIAGHYADHVVPLESAEQDIHDLTKGKKADKLIEASGNPRIVGILHKFIKDGGWNIDDEPAHIHLQGDYPEQIVMDSYHRWFVKNCTITMTCALAPGCKEQILQWMSEGKFNTSPLPVEIWPVAKCAEAYKYKQDKGESVFKILFDWEEK